MAQEGHLGIGWAKGSFPPQLRQFRTPMRTAASGQEYAFMRPGPDGSNAPIPAVRGTATEEQEAIP